MTINEYLALLDVPQDSQLAWNIIRNNVSDNDIMRYWTQSGMTVVGQDLPMDNLSIYRARFDNMEWEDKTDISQFGYIKDVSKIKMCRYNRDNEQVFYASTSFDAAFKESLPNVIPDYVYISKWRKNDETRLKVQLNLCEQPSDTSEVVRFYLSTMKQQLDTNVFKRANQVGQILEAEEIEGYDKLNYKFSSMAASIIFQEADVLLTRSKKCPDHLNLTFKKEAADKLKLESVYKCRCNGINGLCFPVEEIGIPVSNKIEWHKYKTCIKCIKDIVPLYSGYLTNPYVWERVETQIMNAEYELFPNINKSLEELHMGIIIQRNYKVTVLFSVELV